MRGIVGPVDVPADNAPPWGALLQEYNPDGTLRERQGEGAVQPARLRYSYYTAGSGGVGPTILETSMLLAGEEVVAYRDGQKASWGLGFTSCGHHMDAPPAACHALVSLLRDLSLQHC